MNKCTVCCNKCGREFEVEIRTCGSIGYECKHCNNFQVGNGNIHYVPFNLMGTMFPLPGYKSGDLVSYGGMIYRPTGCDLFIHVSGDGHNTWNGNRTQHEARMHPQGHFYCS